MKKTIIMSLIALVATSAFSQDPIITLQTENKIGESITLSIKVSKAEYQDQVWIDLNGNKTLDKGEKVTKFGEEVNYTIQSKEINIYGPVWVLGCVKNKLSAIDVSKDAQYLSSLYCGYNQLTELDLSMNQKLSALSCFNNDIKSIKLSNNTNLKTLNISGNAINETSMLEIVSMLGSRGNNKPGEITATSSMRSERNTITKQMVQVLQEKGWKVFKLVGNKKELL